VAATLLAIGVPREGLEFRCSYPLSKNSREKADLLIRCPHLVAFELKSFVRGADVQKLHELPRQVHRLQEHVRSGAFAQGVVFVTFYGYTAARVSKLLSSWFQDGWRVVGPLLLLEGHALEFAVAETRNHEDFQR
jgi:hypothetical protein